MTEAERLEEIRKVLFPPPIRHEDGSMVSLDSDENLEAALYDLQQQGADFNCCRTIGRVLVQLASTRELLGASEW